MFQTGQILALCCALTWSISIILYKKSGEQIHAVVLNLLKNLLGFALMFPTYYLVEGRFYHVTAPLDFGLVLLSGVLGIGLADALFLASLKRLGASRSALVDCLYSPSVIILSLIFFDEILTPKQLVGAVLVIGAILLTGKKNQEETYITSTRAIVIGSFLGAVSMVFMAGGILIVKPLFESLPLFWILAMRLLGGLIASVVIFAFLSDKKKLMAQVIHSDNKGTTFAACIFGVYISMMFWVASFKYTSASVAAVLNQCSTIFTVLLAAAFLKEKLTPMKMVATVAAFSGVLLIIL